MLFLTKYCQFGPLSWWIYCCYMLRCTVLAQYAFSLYVNPYYVKKFRKHGELLPFVSGLNHINWLLNWCIDLCQAVTPSSFQSVTFQDRQRSSECYFRLSLWELRVFLILIPFTEDTLSVTLPGYMSYCSGGWLLELSHYPPSPPPLLPPHITPLPALTVDNLSGVPCVKMPVLFLCEF